MNPEDRAWQQLVAAARQAKDGRDTAAPYGFSTRVAAMAMAQPAHPLAALFERFSWRALGVASVMAVASVTANFAFTAGTSIEEELLSNDGAVAALFGNS